MSEQIRIALRAKANAALSKARNPASNDELLDAMEKLIDFKLRQFRGVPDEALVAEFDLPDGL